MSHRLLAAGLALALAFVAGCKNGPPADQVPEPDVEIAAPTDDGPIDVYRDSMPAFVGFLWGRNASGAVGVTGSGANVMVWRTLYRFNVSAWTAGDAEFFVWCSGATGTARVIEFVAVADFESLPYRVIRGDVGQYWRLADSGQSLGTFTVEDTGWVHVDVPAARMAAAKAATGWLAVVVRFNSEQAVVPGNLIDLATFESTALPRPFLAW